MSIDKVVEVCPACDENMNVTKEGFAICSFCPFTYPYITDIHKHTLHVLQERCRGKGGNDNGVQ